MSRLLIIFLIIIFILIFLILYTKIYYYFTDNFKLVKSFFKKINNKFSPVEFKKRKIVIISTDDRNDSYIALHDIALKKYSEKHGYSYLRMDNCDKKECTTFWCKIYKIKEELAKNNCDYVLWLDSDTIIVNNNVLLDDYISEYGEPDIIIANDKVQIGNFNIVSLVSCLSSGAFLIKNSEIGRSFIDDCISELKKHDKCIIGNKEQGLYAGICYEQGIMNILLKNTKYSNYVYVSNDKNFIFNDSVYYNKNTIDNNIFIHHLPGIHNKLRMEYFKKVIEQNYNIL
jgi:hypothetical protein